MRGFWKNDTAPIDEEIARAIEHLSELDPESEEYAKAISDLDTLSRIKERVSPTDKLRKETIVSATANILGIGMILGYEKFNVLSSKALGFVIRPKL